MVWSLVWIPGIPYERDWYLRAPLESLYDNSEDLSPSAFYGRKHPLSRRFLDYSFGDGQSLRHDLDEFVRGVSRRDLDRFVLGVVPCV